ncbi:LolA family protein [Sporolactobacillus terrae]|uniref:Outer membrane lipoprotein carrier protein LolA n=1 Tax=Sporolactobacillus terrae TaxID=269673 RepID=A0A410DBX4_9BACL|nr:outer membrane lipoprotein carrier protein LolA [Sporolactobacillus terrae]QAA23564.1 outer membrane lipoprotein carrier protein LolA [Sporolactobacillus terrae]QAA26534.1 outer membrane lipoprotein carrier protein LolA [Sporolactobacillus terrae]UAK15609.1 outer membrane lipoprotein carrier protein LolA [Sporolactobacillus terrae]BBO00069.1 sporulation protein YdcC [Sporolactobacillus terrae]
MKKWSALWLSAILMTALLLSGCGAKSEKDVINDLNKRYEKINSYSTNAVMTFHNHGKAQAYQVNIMYKRPNLYRVSLSDANKANKQMILKNKEGVYVLTPELNKSYRFDSDWPNNRSQAYLYHSLAKDILNDPNPSFTAKENHYIFNTKTNYNTAQLANQEISLKKDLTPETVKIKDKDQKVVVTVTFKNFKVNPSIPNKTFDVKQNMTAANLSKTQSTSAENKSSLKLLYPTAVISGTKLETLKPASSKFGDRYVLKYAGKKPFTLIETKSQTAASSAATLATGTPANLGFAVGSFGDHSLSWSSNGTDFYLASEKLTQDEMITIAQSVNGTVTK